jgi:dethiobiotin synthetase
MTAHFVTATGTDIGKTYVSVGLIHELRRRRRKVFAIKPVVSGYDDWSAPASDPARLLAALELPNAEEEVARVAPWRFRAALAPDAAARLEGKKIDYAALVEFSKQAVKTAEDVLLIEGIGGVMVPIDERHTTLDWMIALKLPTILVAGSYLGTISHSLTALSALRHAGIAVSAVIVSETGGSPVPLEAQVASIQRFAGRVPVLGLPRLAPADHHPTIASLADLV